MSGGESEFKFEIYEKYIVYFSFRHCVKAEKLNIRCVLNGAFNNQCDSQRLSPVNDPLHQPDGLSMKPELFVNNFDILNSYSSHYRPLELFQERTIQWSGKFSERRTTTKHAYQGVC